MGKKRNQTKTTYKKNEFIKSTNVQIEWTEELISEFIKCKQSPHYFIENYVKIVTLDEGLSQFKLRNYQDKIISAFHDNRHVALLMGRQSGKCQIGDSLVTLKNKETGEIFQIPIGEFHKISENSQK